MSSLFITIPIILLVLWLLAMVTAYPIGGLMHFLLAIVFVAILLRVARTAGLGTKEKDQRGSSRDPSQTH